MPKSKVTDVKVVFQIPVSVQTRVGLYAVGGGGWMRFRDDDVRATVFVRFEEDAGRLRAAEIVVRDAESIDTETLRGIPLGRFDAIANSPERSDEIRSGLTHRIALDSVRFNRARRTQAGALDAQLDVPDRRPYGAAFYQDVANAYMRLTAAGTKPGPAIADANHVPVSTAHRWFKVARQRGFLPAGHRGKAG